MTRIITSCEAPKFHLEYGLVRLRVDSIAPNPVGLAASPMIELMRRGHRTLPQGARGTRGIHAHRFSRRRASHRLVNDEPAVAHRGMSWLRSGLRAAACCDRCTSNLPGSHRM